MLIQVCMELHNENTDREQKGLLDAMNFFNIAKGYIITLNQTDRISVGEKTIDMVPMYQVNFSQYNAKTLN